MTQPLPSWYHFRAPNCCLAERPRFRANSEAPMSQLTTFTHSDLPRLKTSVLSNHAVCCHKFPQPLSKEKLLSVGRNCHPHRAWPDQRNVTLHIRPVNSVSVCTVCSRERGYFFCTSPWSLEETLAVVSAKFAHVSSHKIRLSAARRRQQSPTGIISKENVE